MFQSSEYAKKCDPIVFSDPNNLRTESAICGLSIPFLPDFLRDHTLLGETPSEKLREVLERFVRFISGLRKYKDSAFSLRFFAIPELGSTQVSILARNTSQIGLAYTEATRLHRDMQSLLFSYGFSSNTLDQVELKETLKPFTQQPALVEVRQHEAVVPFPTVNQDAFVVHPYWGPVSTFLEPFEVILNLRSPVMVCVFLQPTELSPNENYCLAEASFIAQTVANVQNDGATIHRLVDPNAELVGRIYAAYNKSLVDPFILNIQVISPDPNAAWSAARAFSSAISQRSNLQFSGYEEQELPSGSDLVFPQNQTDYDYAISASEKLIWHHWGSSLATPGKDRLAYLAGAKGAATAFRFPISVRGGVPGIAVHQSPPGFEPGPRPDHVSSSELQLGSFPRNGVAVFKTQDLTRHMLICGNTGSGKTNTLFYLLDQIWREKHIPFMVIESAKTEYRSLIKSKGFEELQVFSLGDETCSPFRLNPFELYPGVSLESHLGRLQSCFDAALPQFGILPSIVASAMEKIYRSNGWKFTDKSSQEEKKTFPTMKDLYIEIIRETERRGYDGETFHNIRAAASGRIGNLLIGSRGLMFGCKKSFPPSELFTRPTVLELNYLNEDDKALTMMFLLTLLREYRELHPGDGLVHLTVVEEAHNVLSNVASPINQEISSDTKAKAVSTFVNLLSEVRAYGEGLVISDQSPEKLTPDVLRNTNLQVSHQLRDQYDRKSISRSMIMDDEQEIYLGKLPIGQAAIFFTGLEKATFINIPLFITKSGMNRIPKNEIVYTWMKPFRDKYQMLTLPFEGCNFCSAICKYREAIESTTLHKDLSRDFYDSTIRFNVYNKEEDRKQNWLYMTQVAKKAANIAGFPQERDAAYCYLAHELRIAFFPSMRNRFDWAYAELSKVKDNGKGLP